MESSRIKPLESLQESSAAALSRDDEFFRAYGATLSLSERLTNPAVMEIRAPDGKLMKPQDTEVEFHGERHQAAYFTTAEVYVTRLLDRTEFRQHCDKYKTYQAVVSNLK
jgi:hypothetical protein